MTMIIIVALFVAVLLLVFWRSVRIVPHSMEDVVERFGKFHRTLSSGFNIVVPGVDHVRERIDRRVQVVSFPPQSAITEDNLAVEVDSAVYIRVVDAYRATYEVANFIQAVEQLTLATLRNVIGGMNLEGTLTSRDAINRELKAVLDLLEATAVDADQHLPAVAAACAAGHITADQVEVLAQITTPEALDKATAAGIDLAALEAVLRRFGASVPAGGGVEAAADIYAAAA